MDTPKGMVRNVTTLGLHCLVMALACVVLATPSTRAAALVIADTSPSDNVFTVSANDFEAGMFVNGNLLQIGLGSPASITLPDTATASLSGSWIDLGLSTALTRTIYIVRQANPTRIAALFSYSVSTDGFLGTITGTFTSDSVGDLGALPPGVPPADVFSENGQSVPFAAAFMGGEIRTETPCATETQPPSVRLLAPAQDQLGMPPVTIPINVRFTSSDNCQVSHEVLKLQGCTIVDGSIFGDRDGLLSDEGIQLNKPALCQFMAQCGFQILLYPTLRVEATDPAGNVGFDQHIIRKSLLKSEVCSRP